MTCGGSVGLGKWLSWVSFHCNRLSWEEWGKGECIKQEQLQDDEHWRELFRSMAAARMTKERSAEPSGGGLILPG